MCVRCETPFADATAAIADIDQALPRPAAPSTTQSHGTIVVTIVAGFLVLAVVLFFSVRDVGPFEGRLLGTPAVGGPTTSVQVEVRNQGDRAGRANCRITLEGTTGGALQGHRFLSQKVPANGVVTQTVQVGTLQTGDRVTGVDC